MEAAAFLSATVTTNNAGFGMASGKLGSKGIFIAEAKQSPATHVADIIENFVKSSKEVRMSSEIAAHRTVKDHFVWKKLGERYLKAYEKARGK